MPRLRSRTHWLRSATSEMEFRDVLAKRRMVRNYSDTPIDADALDRIADAGLRGPSAGFSQGVRLIVVTNESPRHAVAEAAGEREYVAEGFDPWISSAPAQI
ncbi:MAG: nitroreductase family protein, partial [Actinomycetia bacterium]|nr:nitroreductase family protein [Actinomycetes bacterium]